MNSTCTDQPVVDDLKLNNGGEKPRVVDSKTQIKISEKSNTTTDKPLSEVHVLEDKRDGVVKTAGDCPLSYGEDMGVRVQRDTMSGIGGMSLQDGRTQEVLRNISKESVREKKTYENALSYENAIPLNDHAIFASKEINDVESSIYVKSANVFRLSNPSRGRTSVEEVMSHGSKGVDLDLKGDGDVPEDSLCSVNSDARSQTLGECDFDILGYSCNSENHGRTSSSTVMASPHSNHSTTISHANAKDGGQQRSRGGEKLDSEPTESAVGQNVARSREYSAQSASPKLPMENEQPELAPIVKASTVESLSPHILMCCSRDEGSPATIDVTEMWEDAQSDLPVRPEFFQEALTDLIPSSSSQHSSQHSSQSTPSSSSWRTPSVLSTPIEKSSSAAGSLPEGISEVGTTFLIKNPVVSGVQGESHDTPTRSRTSTANSLSTDFSSNVSIATDELNDAIADGLVLGEEDLEFVEVNLELGEHGHPPGAAVVASGAKPKKKGLGGFLTRNIFRKSTGKSSHSPGVESSPPGWKLFGRVPAKETTQRDHMQISEEFQKRGQTHPPTSSLTWKKRHTGLKEASSTTALILENRPLNLPAKDREEEEKHKEEYTKMLKEAKKKELKLYKQKLKKMAQQLKYEDGIKSSLGVWQQEILPKWDEVKKHKKTRDLWWQGVPPSIRGRVWMLAIKNELNITHELFEIFLIRAKDRIRMCSEWESAEGIGLEEIHAASRENSVDVIKLDVARTFPQLCIFQKGGPYFDLLHSVLGAYACYRPDVGYVQGMSFIASVFLLYLDVADAFICFANLINKSCQLAFFRLDQPIMQSYFATFEEYFQDHLPRLYAHFDELGISPDLYIIDWMYTLYSKSLPLDVACRVWDVFFRDGEEFLFRTALGILSLYEDLLLNMDFIQAAQFLTNIPSDIESDSLFKHVDNIDMHQKKFGQVLMQHISASLATQSGNC